MAIKMTTAVRNARLAAIRTATGASGLWRVYAGSVPADANTAIGAQTLLATITLNATMASESGGVQTFNAATPGTAVASGTPSFVRQTDAAGTTTILDLTAGVGSGDVNFPSAISTGQTVGVTTGGTITEANA